MPRRQQPEDYVRNDRWVISYADFITLLFAFFVVMYAMSSVNEEKYKHLSEALSGVFDGLDDGLDNPQQVGQGNSESGFGIFIGGKTDIDVPEVTISPPDQEETDALKTLQEEMEVSFAHLVDDGQLKITGNDLWMSIELRSHYLFPSGSALPNVLADQLLDKIAQMIKGRENPIHVEGFTDNQQISTDAYPSNWELSASRAAAVVRLLSFYGVEPERMAAVGYGEYQPAYSNRTEKGQRLNRRVLIVISRDEKVRRAVSSFGSQHISADAVSTILANPEKEEVPVIEQVETGDGGVIFRQAEPEPLQQENK
ncbi:flagellar motor protein MotD [Neptuniibacter sp.]|uniref:flagellar motor protein MotD n=1 Tax=Neptuniibacter sp. TaxID=1962643 RepID=UPI002613067D|nr:flagellar motor protein MotD [Neptuniibacter sp.]MCP4596501.1 flagellar motor protein MotD [Neptuniibacter sp.]